jgi:hypothetical protein
MKEKELRECATCALCGEKIGKSGMPMFWRVRIERHGIDLSAVQRQTGLAMMLGGHAGIAAAMGPDEEMTKPLMEPVTITVCEPCGTKSTMVAALAEGGT